MNRTEVHERDRDELHHQLKTQRVTWDALKEANTAVCAERDELRGQLAEARKMLVEIRDRLIDRDPPYAVAIDRVLAVLKEE